jgi:hypothetical protein
LPGRSTRKADRMASRTEPRGRMCLRTDIAARGQGTQRLVFCGANTVAYSGKYHHPRGGFHTRPKVKTGGDKPRTLPARGRLNSKNEAEIRDRIYEIVHLVLQKLSTSLTSACTASAAESNLNRGHSSGSRYCRPGHHAAASSSWAFCAKYPAASWGKIACMRISSSLSVGNLFSSSGHMGGISSAGRAVVGSLP